jgi:hypothetical protein
MSSSTALKSMLTSDFPERLALTPRDRRLESRVLVHLVRPGNDTDRLGSSRSASPRQPEPIDDPDGRDETRIRNRALCLARFLAGEYQAVTLEQKRILAELAVEVAQRLEEVLPDVAPSQSAPGPTPRVFQVAS